jgi:2-succinyl-6-hydroxy-2,4-cyclohexadiene-1-carboxylate synthase
MGVERLGGHVSNRSGGHRSVRGHCSPAHAERYHRPLAVARSRRRRRLARLAGVPTPVVLLHGFAATPHHWDRVLAELPAGRFEPLALDLADADPPTPASVCELVRAATDASFALAGYSMGGRLALHAALAMPERVERLVLVSSSAGIEDDSERAARAAADEVLAAQIEEGPIESFVERWRTVALFADDPQWVQTEVAEDERRCAPAALAACLRGLGAGVMPPMWERLGELRMQVAILAGARDLAYAQAGRRLAEAISGSSFQLVDGAGHRVALEAPDAVARALDRS